MNIDGNFPTYEQQQQILTLAQELGVDVDTLIALLGTPTSAASNTTGGNAHAKLNWLLGTLGTVNTNTATANLGASTTAASNSPSAVAHAKLNWLLTNVGTLVNGRVVKSVQAGQLNLTYSSPNANITISAVDKSKTIVLASSSAQVKAGVGVSGVNIALASASNTSLSINAVIPAEYQISLPVQWQVIEFY